MDSYSEILFARPSFTEGVGRVVDMGGTLNEYNNSPSGQQADYYALRSDWIAVGSALRAATSQLAPPTIKKHRCTTPMSTDGHSSCG